MQLHLLQLCKCPISSRFKAQSLYFTPLGIMFNIGVFAHTSETSRFVSEMYLVILESTVLSSVSSSPKNQKQNNFAECTFYQIPLLTLQFPRYARPYTTFKIILMFILSFLYIAAPHWHKTKSAQSFLMYISIYFLGNRIFQNFDS